MLGKKLIVIGLIFLFFVSPSFALNFTISLEYPLQLIAGEKYEGSLTIKNLDEEKGFFSISVLGPRPEWITTEKKTLMLEPGEKSIVKLYFYPSPNAYEATYKFRVYVKAHDGSEKSELLPLAVIQPEKIRFSELKLSCEKCRPESKVKVKFTIINLGVEKREFEVVFRVFDFEKKIKKKIEGRSEEECGIIFNVSKYQTPGKYCVIAEIYDENGEKIKMVNKTFEVIPVENFLVTQKENKGLFDRVVKIKIENKGNVEKAYTIYSNASSPLLSIYLGPKAERTENKYFFTVEVKPGEEKIIVFREFYWYKPVIILVLIAIAIYLKFFYVWGVKIRKNIIYTPPAKEGKAIGISIELKTSKPIKKIVIRDFVPPSFELVKSFETIKPIRKELEEGVELTWKVRSMRAGEERVFHYKIKPKIGIIGKIKLPRAIAKFEIEGKEAEKRSNFPELEGVKESI